MSQNEKLDQFLQTHRPFREVGQTLLKLWATVQDQGDSKFEEFYQSLPALCAYLFGSRVYPGVIHFSMSPDERRLLIDLLSPTGLLLKLLQNAALTSGLAYEVPVERLPSYVTNAFEGMDYKSLPALYRRVLIMDELSSSKSHDSIASKSDNSKPRISSVKSVNFNMFEYFMFSFASSVAQGSGERATGVASAAESTGGQYLSKLSRELQIGFKNPLSTKADNMQSFSALYLQLVTMYIKYFIPLVPQPSTLTAASADTVITSLDSLASNPSQRFIILSMSEALGVILSDQWITQGYRVAEDRYERPSSLRIKCIHTLVAHLSKSNLQDIFTGLPLHDVSPWVDQPVEVIIQRRVISSLQKKLFHFFHNSLEFWPIDEGYSSIVEIWLKYITPYEPNNLDESWLFFIVHNFAFYSVLLRIFIERSVQFDLFSAVRHTVDRRSTHSGHIITKRLSPGMDFLDMLERVMFAYSSDYLRSTLDALEGSYSALLKSSSPTLSLSNVPGNLPKPRPSTVSPLSNAGPAVRQHLLSMLGEEKYEPVFQKDEESGIKTTTVWLMNNIYNSIGRLETYSPLLIPTTSNTPSMSRSGSYAADGPDRPTLAPLRPSDFEKNRRLPKVFPDYPTTTSGVAWLLWTILTGVGWIRKFFDLFHGYMSSDDRGSSENLRLLADVDRAMNRLRKLSECLQELWPALCSIRYNSALYTTKPQASPYLDTIDAESYDMLDHSHPTSLSVEGREQIKSGKRKCVNVDVRVIETERSEAIVQTGEIAILVHISIWLTKQLAGWWACLKAILPWIPDYNFKSIRMLANVVNDVYALLLSLLLLTMFSWFTLLCAALALVLIDVVGAAFISHITRDLHTK